jgi:hypothetical protein
MSPDPNFSQLSAPTSGQIVPLECGNVGDVWESDAAVIRVPIRNTTDRPIRIANLSADCQISRIEPSNTPWVEG